MRAIAVMLDRIEFIPFTRTDTMNRQHIAALCALASLTWGTTATAEGNAGGWEHTLFVYGMGAAIDGKARIGSLEVPVDASISDVFSKLEFGAMGAYRADNGTWSYTVDATYMGLGGSSRTDRGRVLGKADIDQFTLMGTVGRRVGEHLEALFSLAYFDLSNKLELRTTLPVTGETVVNRASRNASWVDPLLGLQYRAPLGERWNVTLRGDVGGFGIGSDLNYQLLGALGWKAGERTNLFFGWRLIAFDYETGRDSNYQRYDLTEQGPMIGFSATF
jgi:hypothetical protein